MTRFTVTTYGPREYLCRRGLIPGDLELRRKIITVATIQEMTARFFGIHRKEMTSCRRAREVAHPRQVAMYLARNLTPHSLPQIGRFFGNRDHTTVIWAIQQVEERRLDPVFDTDLRELKRRILA